MAHEVQPFNTEEFKSRLARLTYTATASRTFGMLNLEVS